MTVSMSGGPMAHLLSAGTDRGRVRDENEDAVLAIRIEHEGNNPWGIDLVAAVADGMGGHVGGGQVSQMATDLVRQIFVAKPKDGAFRPPQDMGPVLTGVFDRINRAILDLKIGEGFRPAGTTLLIACVRGSTYWLGHVGDSRAYLVSDTDVVRLTEDHSWVEEQVRKGLMTGDQADRSPFRNQLTQAVGTTETLDVETHTGDLGTGRALVLCTDGLTEYVTVDEIGALVRSNPETAPERLIALANSRGGEDNVTVVVVAHPSLASVTPLSAAPDRVPLRGAAALSNRAGTGRSEAATKNIPAHEVRRHVRRRTAGRWARVGVAVSLSVGAIFTAMQLARVVAPDTDRQGQRRQSAPAQQGEQGPTPLPRPTPTPNIAAGDDPTSSKRTAPGVAPNPSPVLTRRSPKPSPKTGGTPTASPPTARATFAPPPTTPVQPPPTPTPTSAGSPVATSPAPASQVPTPSPTPPLRQTPQPAVTEDVVRVDGTLIGKDYPHIEIQTAERREKVSLRSHTKIKIEETERGKPPTHRSAEGGTNFPEVFNDLHPGAKVSVWVRVSSGSVERYAERIEASYKTDEGLASVSTTSGSEKIRLEGRREYNVNQAVSIALGNSRHGLSALKRVNGTRVKIWLNPDKDEVWRIVVVSGGDRPGPNPETR